MGKKISFPMQGENYKRATTNGVFNPTTIPQALQSAKNKAIVAARIKTAKKTNLNSNISIPFTNLNIDLLIYLAIIKYIKE